MKVDGSLARNIDFEVANSEVPRKTRRKTSILKLQSVKIGGSLARNARFDAPTCLVSSLWFSCGLAAPMGEAAKHVLLGGFQAGCHAVLHGRRGALWHYNLFDNVSKVVLCGTCSTFASFSQDALQFSWQAQHFGDLCCHFAWQAQHFRRVALRALHSALYTPHCTLYTSHSTLHTPHCRACHGICTLSQLHAAVTMRFAKTPNTTRLKCCVRHAKWRWRSPKCCACHKKCNASSENVTKVLRLPHKTTFDTLRNTSECHEVPRPKRGYAAFESSKSDHFYRTHHRHGHMALSRSPPNGCGRLRNVWRTQPQPPDPQSEKGTLATRSGNAWKSWKKHCSHGSEASESAARRSSACSCRASILRSSVKIPSFRICSVQFLRV